MVQLNNMESNTGKLFTDFWIMLWKHPPEMLGYLSIKQTYLTFKLYHQMENMIHGFFNFWLIISVSQMAVGEVVAKNMPRSVNLFLSHHLRGPQEAVCLWALLRGNWISSEGGHNRWIISCRTSCLPCRQLIVLQSG